MNIYKLDALRGMLLELELQGAAFEHGEDEERFPCEQETSALRRVKELWEEWLLLPERIAELERQIAALKK